MRHQTEQRAMARGSKFPVQDWHRCRRYWHKGLECAFHGLKEEDEEDQEDDDRPREHPERPFRPAPTPITSPAPVLEPTGGRSGEKPEAVELVPAVIPARIPEPVKLLIDKEPPPRIPVEIPKLPAQPNYTPLYIPDENIPEWTPPGMEKAMAAVGATSEEAFVQYLSQEGNSTGEREQATVEAVAGREAEGGFQEYGALAIAFTAMFTANSVAHLWQTYNARSKATTRTESGKRGGSGWKPSRRTFSKPGRRLRTEIRKRAVKVPRKTPPKSTRPLPQPVRATVGAGAGRGIIFRANVFRRGILPTSQKNFDTGFHEAAKKVPTYDHLASWQEEAFFE